MAVRRQVALMWKEGVQSGQKAKRDTQETLFPTLKAIVAEGSGACKRFWHNEYHNSWV
jgi:hypothetical protein